MGYYKLSNTDMFEVMSVLTDDTLGEMYYVCPLYKRRDTIQGPINGTKRCSL